MIKMMVIGVVKMVVLGKMVGITQVLVKSIEIREGEAGGLALGVFGVLMIVVGWSMVPRCRLFDSAVLGSLYSP